MKKKNDSQYVKRTQRDYSYSFKMQVVKEVESGSIGASAKTFVLGGLLVVDGDDAKLKEQLTSDTCRFS